MSSHTTSDSNKRLSEADLTYVELYASVGAGYAPTHVQLLKLVKEVRAARKREPNAP